MKNLRLIFITFIACTAMFFTTNACCISEGQEKELIKKIESAVKRKKKVKEKGLEKFVVYIKGLKDLELFKAVMSRQKVFFIKYPRVLVRLIEAFPGIISDVFRIAEGNEIDLLSNGVDSAFFQRLILNSPSIEIAAGIFEVARNNSINLPINFEAYRRLLHANDYRTLERILRDDFTSITYVEYLKLLRDLGDVDGLKNVFAKAKADGDMLKDNPKIYSIYISALVQLGETAEVLNAFLELYIDPLYLLNKRIIACGCRWGSAFEFHGSHRYGYKGLNFGEGYVLMHYLLTQLNVGERVLLNVGRGNNSANNESVMRRVANLIASLSNGTVITQENSNPGFVYLRLINTYNPTNILTARFAYDASRNYWDQVIPEHPDVVASEGYVLEGNDFPESDLSDLSARTSAGGEVLLSDINSASSDAGISISSSSDGVSSIGPADEEEEEEEEEEEGEEEVEREDSWGFDGWKDDKYDDEDGDDLMGGAKKGKGEKDKKKKKEAEEGQEQEQEQEQEQQQQQQGQEQQQQEQEALEDEDESGMIVVAATASENAEETIGRIPGREGGDEGDDALVIWRNLRNAGLLTSFVAWMLSGGSC